MAQGKTKLKKLPASIKQKQKHQKKILGPKKGARNIAPKKSHKVEGVKIQKTLQKMINSNLEREITLKAQAQEAKNFNVVKAPDKKSGAKKDQT